MGDKVLSAAGPAASREANNTIQLVQEKPKGEVSKLFNIKLVSQAFPVLNRPQRMYAKLCQGEFSVAGCFIVGRLYC